MQINSTGGVDKSENDISNVSSFEVLVQKLKCRLGDQHVLAFFNLMLKNDSFYRD